MLGIRKRVSLFQIVFSVILGVVVGYVLGYAFMGTAAAMFSSSTNGFGKKAQTVKLEGSLSLSTSLPAVETVKVVKERDAVTAKQQNGGKTIHSILTSNGSPYQNFQGRIMYATYQMVQKMPGGEYLTGFTRILHRSTPDELMQEVPTFRANPLHPSCDQWCDFPVADRPNAVQQWIDAVGKEPSMLKGAWVLLLECDYVWMKPVQAPDANDPTARGLSFAFDYIQPQHPACVKIIQKLYGGRDPKDVPNSGPAPVLLRFTELVKITPDWERVTADIEASEEAKKVLDWVREMYAWDIGVALNKVDLVNEASPASSLICQPPHDVHLGNASMFHYTWGPVYNIDGKPVWHFDKRDYTSKEVALKPPHLPMPPEWKEGIKLQDGLPVSKELHSVVVAMLTQMNKAIDSLPALTA